MSVIITALFEPVQLTNAAALYYTSTGVRTGIDKATVSNPDAATPYSVTVHWVPSGGAVSNANMIIPARFVMPLEALDLWPFIGQTLGVGDQIWAFANVAAKLNFFVSGRQFS